MKKSKNQNPRSPTQSVEQAFNNRHVSVVYEKKNPQSPPNPKKNAKTFSPASTRFEDAMSETSDHFSTALAAEIHHLNRIGKSPKSSVPSSAGSEEGGNKVADPQKLKSESIITEAKSSTMSVHWKKDIANKAISTQLAETIKTAILHLSILSSFLHFNMLDTPLYIFNQGILNLSEEVEQSIPAGVVSAALFAINLNNVKIVKSRSTEPFFGLLELFILDHLHHWIELMSLIEKLNDAVQSIVSLIKIFSFSLPKNHLIRPLLSDAKLVLRHFMSPISDSALQVYFSAIPLSPSQTTFHQHFVKKIQKYPIPRVTLGAKNWPECVQTIASHADKITSVAISSNGTRVYSASSDFSAKVFDVETGLELKTLISAKENNNNIECICLSKSNSHLLVACFETVTLFNMNNSKVIRKFEGHDAVVKSVAFRNDEKMFVSGGEDYRVRVWDILTGEQIFCFNHTETINSVAYIGKDMVVSAGEDYIVKVWSLKYSRLLKEMPGHEEVVNEVVVFQEKKIISCSHDTMIKIWSADTPSVLEKKTLDGHGDLVLCVDVSSDGKIVSGGCDNAVRVWSSDGTLLYTFLGHNAPITSVKFSGNAQLIVSGSEDKLIKVWDNSEKLSTYEQDVPEKYIVEAIAISPDGTFIAAGGTEKILRLYSTKTGKFFAKLEGHMETITAVAVCVKSTLVISGSFDSDIKLWDSRTRKLVQSYVGSDSMVSAIAFSLDDDRRFIISGQRNGKIIVWDSRKGIDLKKIKGHKDVVQSVVMTPDLKSICSGCADGTVRVWDIANETTRWVFDRHVASILLVDLSLERKVLRSSSSDGECYFWDLQTGECLEEEPEVKFINQHTSRQSRLEVLDGWLLVGGEMRCCLRPTLKSRNVVVGNNCVASFDDQLVIIDVSSFLTK